MDFDGKAQRKPVRIAAIGAGNRTNTYMVYIRQHPELARLVAVAEPNEMRRNSLADEFCVPADCRYHDYRDFFNHPADCDAVIICTPDNAHYEPTMMAISRHMHVLLEKPIAQTMEECRQIAEAAHRSGVMVSVCHVLRYFHCYRKIKEIVSSGALGEVITINHIEGVGIDRATHSYVRGIWNHRRESNPMLLAKCCHDIDFLTWIVGSNCRRVCSFGSLRWFREANAPRGSALRCIDCGIEAECPFSAVDLYKRRHEWIRNFDVPDGKTIDDVIDEELRCGRYGRCVYHCDNDVVDNQAVLMEFDNKAIVTMAMDIFTRDAFRKTDIKLSFGEINCDERKVSVTHFRSGRHDVYDYTADMQKPYHGGADLRLIADFIDAVADGGRSLPTLIDETMMSHYICFEAERSRAMGQSVEMPSA